MIKISRVGSVPGLDELSPRSVVFLGDEALTSSLPELQPHIATEAAGAHGSVTWVGPDHRLTTLVHDADGRLIRPLLLPHNGSLPVGSQLNRDDPAEIVIRTADPDAPEVRLPTEGARAGALLYRGLADGSASVRFFHPRKPTGIADAAPFGGFRFQVFAADPSGLAADVQHDPARPYDPVQSRAVPVSSLPRVSTFRTRWGSPVTLTVVPQLSAYVQAWDPELGTAYTTLDGPWAWAADDGGSGWLELMAGLSSTEYVRGPASWTLQFVAGAPAYAPHFDGSEAGPPIVDGGFPLVCKASGTPYDITTAWVYPQPAARSVGPTGAGYYSQPDRAPLFTPGPTGTMLRALSLEAAPLPTDPPAGPAPAPSFPAAPYAGLDAGLADPPSLPIVQRFESEVLAAARTDVIYSFPGAGPRGLASSPGPTTLGTPAGDRLGAPGPLGVSGPSGPTGPTGPVARAVTPQGMLSAFSPDLTSWRELVLATNGSERIIYTEVTGSLREAMLANQLFLVVSDPAKLYQHCSATYRISNELVQQLRTAHAPDVVIIMAQRLVGYLFASRDYFLAELQRHLSEPEIQAWQAILLSGSEQLRLTLGGWSFDLASGGWAAGDDSTLLILKLGDGDLRTLAGDLSRWTLAAEFNADPQQTQQRLVHFLDETVRRAAQEPELQPFVDIVLAGGRASWTGLLYLNAPVPTRAFPPELAALAAGFPSGLLRAHHLGVTLSPIAARGGVLQTADSSLFGLILYDDPTDLVYGGLPYDFKVLSLRVRFANSAVASFTSQIELLVARLFGELTTLRGSLRGSNLLLDGSLQKGAYQFASAARSDFAIDSQVLDQVTVSRARFVTAPGEAGSGRTRARFILDGDVGFRRLGDFDLFGFGPAENAADAGSLVFSNLIVSMDFDPADPRASREFSFVAGQMALDPASSRARPESLPHRFPLSAAGMLQSSRVTDAQGGTKVAMPPDLGFIPVESPLGDGGLGQEWYGLEMTLSFGSPGALAPSLGFSGALLAAWSPASGSPDVAVGLRLPGSAGGKKSLTIMGPLKLGIGRLAFLQEPSTQGYLLRLQNVALSFLGLSFPSGGRTDALLFGDPDPRSANSALGWYLAYKKDEDKKDDKPSITVGRKGD